MENHLISNSLDKIYYTITFEKIYIILRELKLDNGHIPQVKNFGYLKESINQYYEYN